MVGLIVVNVTIDGLEMEPTATTTGPDPGGVVDGTWATICVLLQLVMVVADAPLKVTVHQNVHQAPAEDSNPTAKSLN